MNVDVVIVGGGFAGLSTALRLVDEESAQGKKLSYVILEGEDRLGGRTRGDENPDIDYGGAYLGAAQNYIQYLMRRYLIGSVKTYLPQDKAWLYHQPDKTVKPFPGNNPLDMPGGDNAIHILSELDRLTLRVRGHLEDPWNSPDASELDNKTVAEWILEEKAKYKAPDPSVGMSAETEQAFILSVRAAFSLEPGEISMLFLLYYAAAAGSYAALVDVAGGEGAAEGSRFMFGTQELIGKLVETVGVDNIKQGARVSEIVHEDGGVTVKSSAGNYHAQRVVVAMSPTMSNKITYCNKFTSSAEGQMRDLLSAAMEKAKGRTIKGFLRFKRPMWRTKKMGDHTGNMGFLLSVADKEQFPVDWTLDNCWELDGLLPPGVPVPPARYSLMTFIAGGSYTIWSKQPETVRKQAVIDHLRAVYDFVDGDLLNENDVLSNYIEYDWKNAPSGMPAPASMMPVGTLTKYGPALRTPVGLIHWAGTETAREWVGYMDGAVESGFRAAGEVLAAL